MRPARTYFYTRNKLVPTSKVNCWSRFRYYNYKQASMQTLLIVQYRIQILPLDFT